MPMFDPRRSYGVLRTDLFAPRGGLLGPGAGGSTSAPPGGDPGQQGGGGVGGGGVGWTPDGRPIYNPNPYDPGSNPLPGPGGGGSFPPPQRERMEPLGMPYQGGLYAPPAAVQRPMAPQGPEKPVTPGPTWAWDPNAMYQPGGYDEWFTVFGSPFFGGGAPTPPPPGWQQPGPSRLPPATQGLGYTSGGFQSMSPWMGRR